MTLALQNDDRQLCLSEENGAIQRLTVSGHHMLLPAKEAFTLGFRQRDSGDLDIIRSTEFGGFAWRQEPGKIILTYTGHGRYRELCVCMVVRVRGAFFSFVPQVCHLPSGGWLEWIDAPQVCVSEAGAIFWPKSEGVLVRDPRWRERVCPYHVLGFLDKSSGGYYPGDCQMQFMSWQDSGRMIYFGAHDREHGTKGIEFAPDGAGRVRLSLQTFCGSTDAEEYLSPFEYVLYAGDGDWMDACGLYRDWLQEDGAFAPGDALPPMVEDSPVVMIYPVRGEGDDKGRMEEGNEYFPYDRVMPLVRRYAKAFDSKILALLMHWEGTAPWAPPYVWPPFGGEKMLRDYTDSLHREGHYIGVYCSGSAWTQKSCIIPYSRERECEEKGLRKHMIRGPHGEINALICNGEQSQRLGYDMCLTEAWSRQTIRDEIVKLADAGLDYAQFFDQNLGGGFHACYCRGHHHPPVPGRWQTQAMQSLLQECVADIRKKGSAMILGCEAAAADAYLRDLPFNDLRPNFNWDYGVPVPGYAYVFHETVNNFMGNQCGIHYWLDNEKTPENLLYRIAYAFSAGDLLSIVLGPQGTIHWGWTVPWSVKAPEQHQLITLIRNLTAARKNYARFLKYGRMEKPILKVESPSFELVLTGRTETVPSCFHSSWQSREHERGEMVTNFLPREQVVRVTVPDGYSVVIDRQAHVGEFSLVLKPLDAVCCVVMKQLCEVDQGQVRRRGESYDFRRD